MNKGHPLPTLIGVCPFFSATIPAATLRHAGDVPTPRARDVAGPSSVTAALPANG